MRMDVLTARGSSNHFAAVNQSIGATTDEVFLRVQRLPMAEVDWSRAIRPITTRK
jgi:hypothetical protein